MLCGVVWCDVVLCCDVLFCIVLWWCEGGGMPVGAYGGRRDIMQMVAPSGPVYQAGTASRPASQQASQLAVSVSVRGLKRLLPSSTLVTIECDVIVTHSSFHILFSYLTILFL